MHGVIRCPWCLQYYNTNTIVLVLYHCRHPVHRIHKLHTHIYEHTSCSDRVIHVYIFTCTSIAHALFDRLYSLDCMPYIYLAEYPMHRTTQPLYIQGLSNKMHSVVRYITTRYHTQYVYTNTHLYAIHLSSKSILRIVLLGHFIYSDRVTRCID